MNFKKIIKHTGVIVGLILGCQCSNLGALEVVLAWDCPTNNVDGTALADLSGYKLYYGSSSSRNYSAILDVGNTNQFKVTGLLQGSTYYFSVTACVSNDSQSEYSSELVWTAADTTPPSISSVSSVSLTADASGMAAVPNLIQNATATDNCSPSASVVLSQVPSAGTLIGSGITSVILTATDQAGNSAQATVLVTVALALPSVTLSSPVNNAIYTAPATIPLTANVAANGHSLTKVQFLDGTNLLGETTSPFACTWSNVTANTYTTLFVRLVYDAGTIDSTPVTVVVNPPPDTTPPSISVVSSVSLTADASGMAAVPNLVQNATVSDNCSPSASIVLSQVPSAGTLIGSGITSVILTATDQAGNSAQTTVLVTVTVPPPVVVPPVVVDPLPAPWNTQDIGSGITTGSVSFSSGTYTLTGSGNVSGSADKFRFVYQTLSGNGEIKARVASLQNAGTTAKAGIMIRESLATGSRQTSLSLLASGKLEFLRRTSTGGSVKITTSTGNVTPNNWIRLVRKSSTITAYKSSNGTTWTSIGSQYISMASTISFGLVTASGTTGTLSTASMDNVTVVP